MNNQDFDFNVEGLKEVEEMLKQLPNSINERIQQDLHKQAAKIVKKELEQSTPDGVNDKSSSNKAENNVVIKSDPSSKTGVNIGFNKKAWYVKLIEKGTKVRNVGKNKKGKYKKGNRGKIERKPFIEPAHNRAAPKVIEFLQQNYIQLMDKAIKKQLRRISKPKK